MKEVLSKLKTNFPNTKFKVASIYYKKTASLKADFSLYETNEWIEFFWEKDYI
jgi:xanthine phosphoribosyltransferase